jgi:hypothetical protein
MRYDRNPPAGIIEAAAPLAIADALNHSDHQLDVVVLSIGDL